MTVRILRGDCRDVLKTLPDASVHCVVTSPPYWGLRDYGVDGQIGLEPTPQEWVDAMVLVFRDVWRVLRADGTAWVNLGDTYTAGGLGGDTGKSGLQGSTESQDQSKAAGQRIGNGSSFRRDRMERQDLPHKSAPALRPKNLVGVPWRFAFALQADGWYLRQDIIWEKPNPMPESVRDRCTKAHEYIFLLSKSERYFFDQEAILEPASENTHARLSQNVQAQIGSDRANGGTRAERPMKAVSRSMKPVAGWDTGPGGHSTLGKNRPQDDGDTRKLLRDVGVGDKARPRKAAPNDSGIKNNESFDEAMAIMPMMRNKRSVWTVPTEGFKEAHFATFPTALIEPCILAGCPAGGTVLDPFGGAGTTGLVADRHQRNAILIELNESYAEMARRRIEGEAPMFAQVEVT